MAQKVSEAYREFFQCCSENIEYFFFIAFKMETQFVELSLHFFFLRNLHSVFDPLVVVSDT